MLQVETIEPGVLSLLNKIMSSGRPTKENFHELSEYLQFLTLDQIVEEYLIKYPSNMMKISIPLVLTDFRYAEESENPISLKAQTWESVKKIISRKVSEYLK